MYCYLLSPPPWHGCVIFPSLPRIMTMMNKRGRVGSGTKEGATRSTSYPHQSNCVASFFYVRGPWAMGIHKTKKKTSAPLSLRDRVREMSGTLISFSFSSSFSFPIPFPPPFHFASLLFFRRLFFLFPSHLRGYTPRLHVLGLPHVICLSNRAGLDEGLRSALTRNDRPEKGSKEAVSRELVRPSSYRGSWVVAQGETRPSTKCPGGGAHSFHSFQLLESGTKKEKLLFPHKRYHTF